MSAFPKMKMNTKLNEMNERTVRETEMAIL